MTEKMIISSDNIKINIFRVLRLTFNSKHGILKKGQKLKHHHLILYVALASCRIFVRETLSVMKTDYKK
jgi:hypothetical protein